MTEFGRWVSQTGRPQNEIARKCGISPGHLHHLMHGRRVPSLTLALRLQKLTGIPALRLMLAKGKAA